MVIMSDECRTAACDLRRDTSGVSVFAKYQATGREQRVEVFYTSAPGRAAAELDTSIAKDCLLAFCTTG